MADISFYKPCNIVQSSQDTIQSASTIKFSEFDKPFTSERIVPPVKPSSTKVHPSYSVFHNPRLSRFETNFLIPHCKIICCCTSTYLILSVVFFLSECISMLYWLSQLPDLARTCEREEAWSNSETAVYLFQFFDFLRQSVIIAFDFWICKSLLIHLKSRSFSKIKRSLALYKVAFLLHLFGNLISLVLLASLSLWESQSLLYQYYSLNYYYGVYSPAIAPVFGAVFIFAFSLLVCVIGYDQLQQYSQVVLSYERLKGRDTGG